MQKKKDNVRSFIFLLCVFITGIILFSLTGCSSDSADADIHTVESVQESEVTSKAADQPDVAQEVTKDILGFSGVPVINVTSDNLHDGIWDQIISNTDEGQNRSPQLTWTPVDDAACYVIYMTDTDAQNWLHWKSNGVTETTLPEGWASTDDYIGPYPPSGGTHHYEVYVIALKEGVERAKGGLDSVNPKFTANVQSLDETDSGAGGNILAIGHLVGTYASK